MKQKKNISQKTFHAFSLIELLVVVGIFILISTIVLINHSRFNSSSLLGALAYDIALSLREAQVFGVAVRQFNTNFQVGYGVRFSGPSSYIFFIDQNQNTRYDPSVDTIIRNYALGRGHSVVRYCGVTGTGVEVCSNSGTPITHLDIVFLRPDPDAIISSNQAGTYSFGRIVIGAPGGATRTVEIASTGQISIKNQ